MSSCLSQPQAHPSLIFHHIGVACHNIEKELAAAYAPLGYQKVSDYFEDPLQGVRGVFVEIPGGGINKGILELLENMPGCHTLDSFLMRRIQAYHLAFTSSTIEHDMQMLINHGAIVVSPLKQSIYFRKRIGFFALKNLQLIELIEI